MGAAVAVPAAIAVATSAASIIYSRKAQKDQQKQLDAANNRPLPVATPLPTATNNNPAQTDEERRRKLASLRYGFASTITSKPSLTSSPAALPGAGPLKATLGS